MSVLVVAEAGPKGWRPATRETVAAARRTANDAGSPLMALVIGSETEEAAQDLAAWSGANEVLAVDDPSLEIYAADAYEAALDGAVREMRPQLVLLPHTYQTRDYAPAVAESFGQSLLADAVELRLEDGSPVVTRPVHRSKLRAEVEPKGDPPFFVSLQQGAFAAAPADGPPCAVRRIDFKPPTDRRHRPEPAYQQAAEGVDLGSAPRIVSVGRGLKAPENVAQAQELAKALGAELAASRPVCDSGWLPPERQIGSSGQSVSPKLYLALGISGAIQHVVGMKGSDVIVAVNTDASAPIFEIADYGIVGDLFEVIPHLIGALNERASS